MKKSSILALLLPWASLRENLIIFRLLIMNPASSIAWMIFPILVYESGLIKANVLLMQIHTTNTKRYLDMLHPKS